MENNNLCKICSKCGLLKSVEEFHNNKRGILGTVPHCKECSKKWREENKEYLKLLSKEYYDNNKEYFENWRKNNKENRKQYELDNIDKLRKYRREYYKNKRRRDNNCRLLFNLRSRLHSALKETSKAENTSTLIKCSPEELKRYLENQFTEKMSWENYGILWEIDHIIPCFVYNLEDFHQQYMCFATQIYVPFLKVIIG